MSDPTKELARGSRLITIASGKGGVGKTWLSITLAMALSRLGDKIALFDGDLGLANVDIQLGLMADVDVSAFFAGDKELADIITRQSEADGTGFDIIPGQSGTGALGNLAKEALINLRMGLIKLSADYDHIMLDLAAGIDPSVTTLSLHNGKVLVVMTGDPTSLTDAYAFIKVTRGKNPDANIHIVVNNVADKASGEKAYSAIKRACEGFLSFTPKLAGIIRQDPKVPDSIRSQIPLLVRYPDSDAGKDVMALAQYVLKS